MINIRPVSDLRNKYPEIEELVLKEDEAVYLTKNGYGSMVVMSLEKYTEIMEQLGKEIVNNVEDEKIKKIEKEIDEEINEKNVKYITHKEAFAEIRRKLNEQ